MAQLRIKILGTGGCLNEGLPYNGFIINDHILVEAPPDLMLSINRTNVDIASIKTVFISHLHGDHIFGLPFFIINKWLGDELNKLSSHLSIIGPDGTESYVKKLTELAFTTEHPCYHWLDQRVSFRRINDAVDIGLNSLTLTCFKLEHLVETYGFYLASQGETLFSYVADTKWCSQVENALLMKPKVVLMDMNGGPSHVHISVNEVIEKGLPLTGGETIYYGTHLSNEFEVPYEKIKCARQGEEIIISDSQS